MIRPIVVEVLENRIAPAGVVTGIFKDGILTLQGDGEANELSILQNEAGIVVVRPEAGTYLDIKGDISLDIRDTGVSVRLDQGPALRAVIANLGEGDDTFTISGIPELERLTLDLGNGTNSTTLWNISTSGALTYTGGNWTDTLWLRGDQARLGSLEVKMDYGFNALVCEVDTLEISGNLHYRGGESVDNVSLKGESVVVRGSIGLEMGDDSNEANIQAQRVEIQGDLNYSGGTAGDRLILLSQATTVDGDITMQEGRGFNYNALSLGEANISGAVNFQMDRSSTFAEDMPLLFNECRLDLTGGKIGGGVSMIAEAGTHHFTLSASGEVHIGPVTVKSGAGNDSFELLASKGSLGKVEVDLGDGNNQFHFARNQQAAAPNEDWSTHRLTVASLSFKGGSGEDHALVNLPTLEVAGTIELSTGAGAVNSLELAADSKLSARGIRLIGGAGNDFLMLGNQEGTGSYFVPKGIQLIGGTGQDEITAGGTLYTGGDLRLSGGEIVGLCFGTAHVLGEVQIEAGTGNVGVDIGGNVEAEQLVYLGSAGNDNLMINTESLTLSGKLQIAMGNGENQAQLSVARLEAGELIFSAGNGQDILIMEHGDLKLAGDLDARFGAGSNTCILGVTNGLQAANLSLAGGNDADYLQFTAGTLLTSGNVSFGLGGGANGFALTAGAVETGGSFTLTGKGGEDSFTIQTQRMSTGDFTIDAGDGGNRVQVDTAGTARIRGKLSLASGDHSEPENTVMMSAGDLVIGDGFLGSFGEGHNQLALRADNTLVCHGEMNLNFKAAGTHTASIHGGGLLATGPVKIRGGSGELAVSLSTSLDLPGARVDLARIDYHGGTGNDSLVLESGRGTIHGPVTLNMGRGLNWADLHTAGTGEKLSVEGPITFNSKTGNRDGEQERVGQGDSFFMSNVQSQGKLDVRMGGAQSSVVLSGCMLENLRVHLGGGDDSFHLAAGPGGSIIRGIARIIGGTGNDTFQVDAGVVFQNQPVYYGGYGEYHLLDDVVV